MYKTKGYMSYEDKELADKLDQFLADHIQKIEKKLDQMGLVKLKRKSGVIKLWYQVGKELRSLWNTAKKDFRLPDTHLPIFIKAVYDHSNKLKPGSGRSERFRNSHLYYCYTIAGLPWQSVEAAGNWTEWSEFLDSKRIRNDPRIAEWFTDRPINCPKNKRKLVWFRTITRAIRHDLKEIDTTVLEKRELFQKLDRILNNIQTNDLQ